MLAVVVPLRASQLLVQIAPRKMSSQPKSDVWPEPLIVSWLTEPHPYVRIRPIMGYDRRFPSALQIIHLTLVTNNILALLEELLRPCRASITKTNGRMRHRLGSNAVWRPENDLRGDTIGNDAQFLSNVACLNTKMHALYVHANVVNEKHGVTTPWAYPLCFSWLPL